MGCSPVYLTISSTDYSLWWTLQHDFFPSAFTGLYYCILLFHLLNVLEVIFTQWHSNNTRWTVMMIIIILKNNNNNNNKQLFGNNAQFWSDGVVFTVLLTQVTGEMVAIKKFKDSEGFIVCVYWSLLFTSAKVEVMRPGRFVCRSLCVCVCRITAKIIRLIKCWWWCGLGYGFRVIFPLPSPLQNRGFYKI